MTGKGIRSTVNRAFMVIGSLFFLGGIYLGTLTFVQALISFRPCPSSSMLSASGGMNWR